MTIDLVKIVPKDFNGLDLPSFNASQLSRLERVLLNYRINASDGSINNWYLNFTADGPNACATGNRQVGTCYNFTNPVNKWIKYDDGLITPTFDYTKTDTDDGITYTLTQLTSQLFELNITMKEHYNPNIYKPYNANYDFTNVKWQTAKDQTITKTDEACINISDYIIPVDADFYKLDFQVNHSSDPSNNLPQEPEQPLDSYLSNKTCGESDQGVLVGSVFHLELSGSLGTKYRTIFTGGAASAVGVIRSIRLRSEDSNPNKYYALKTYDAQTPLYQTHWYYSNDDGATYSNLNDGYETDFNLNWFSCNVDPTITRFSLFVDTSSLDRAENDSLVWNLNCAFNVRPNIVITSPAQNATVTEFPITVGYIASDVNFDTLSTNLQLYQNGTFIENIALGIVGDGASVEFNCNNCQDGLQYTIFGITCETSTAQLLCDNTTRTFTYQPRRTVTATFPIKLSITPNHAEPDDMVLIEALSSVDNISNPNLVIFKIDVNETKILETAMINNVVPNLYFYELNVSNYSFDNYIAYVNFTDIFNETFVDAKTFSVKPRGVIDFEGLTPNVVETNTSVLFASQIQNNEEIINYSLIEPELKLILNNVIINSYNLTTGLNLTNGLLTANYTFNQSGTYILEWQITYFNRTKVNRELIAVTKKQNVNNSQLQDLINTNMDKLNKIINNTEEIQDFSEEEIFLITDSVNSLSQLNPDSPESFKEVEEKILNILETQKKLDSQVTGAATSESGVAIPVTFNHLFILLALILVTLSVLKYRKTHSHGSSVKKKSSDKQLNLLAKGKKSKTNNFAKLLNFIKKPNKKVKFDDGIVYKPKK